MESIKEITDLMALVSLDVTKFKLLKSKTSATRARQTLLLVKKKCDILRRDILSESKDNADEKKSKKLATLKEVAVVEPDPVEIERSANTLVRNLEMPVEPPKLVRSSGRRKKASKK